MVTWENRWTDLQAYFTDKWLERKQYSNTTANQLRFKEAALQAQEAAAAEEEGETQAMLLMMIQDHHQKQITQMEATNKANMDAMMEKMNSLVAANKENTRQNKPATKNPTAGGTKSPGRKRCYAQTASVLCTTSPIAATNWRQIKQTGTQGGNQSSRRHQPFDRDRGQQ
jgi:hypothetical protein